MSSELEHPLAETAAVIVTVVEVETGLNPEVPTPGEGLTATPFQPAEPTISLLDQPEPSAGWLAGVAGQELQLYLDEVAAPAPTGPISTTLPRAVQQAAQLERQARQS